MLVWLGVWGLGVGFGGWWYCVGFGYGFVVGVVVWGVGLLCGCGGGVGV